jgi:glucosamine 6-phosphate synthetase-like amidotransferase/phosphosugar isomerase protein
MCGIVALVGSQEAAPLLLERLRQLEYRGYDSAGIATVGVASELRCLRAEGKLVNLAARYEAQGARRASPASAIRAGRPTANRRSATPIRTWMERAPHQRNH